MKCNANVSTVQVAITRLKHHKFDGANELSYDHCLTLILTFVYTLVSCLLRLTQVDVCQISC